MNLYSIIFVLFVVLLYLNLLKYNIKSSVAFGHQKCPYKNVMKGNVIYHWNLDIYVITKLCGEYAHFGSKSGLAYVKIIYSPLPIKIFFIKKHNHKIHLLMILKMVYKSI